MRREYMVTFERMSCLVRSLPFADALNLYRSGSKTCANESRNRAISLSSEDRCARSQKRVIGMEQHPWATG